MDTANLGNGITEIWTYNNRLQAQSITTKNSSNVELLKLTYGYNAQNNGNLATQTIATGPKTYQQSYQYDDLNRLTRVDETTQGASTGSWWTGFGYGRYGNVWFEGPGKPGIGAQNLGQFEEATNRLKQAPDGTTLAASAYDASGNLANHPVIGVMTYDGLNRLVRFENGSTKFSWGYDAEGRRVRRKDESTANGNVITFVFDASGRLAAEVGGKSITTCTRCFLTHDSLGSTRLMTDGSGVVKQRRDFMPFGEEILANATFGNRHQVTDGGVTTYNTVSGPTQQFTGKERDAETGLDYFGARYFSGAQGRFLSTNPEIIPKITNAQAWNKYSYANNNPTRYIDPDGRAPQESAGLRQDAAVHDFVEGRISQKQFGDRLGANAPVAVGAVGIGVMTGGTALEVGPGILGLARFMFGWMLSHPGEVQQTASSIAEGLSGAAPGSLTGNLKRLSAAELSTGVRFAEQSGLDLKVSGHVGAEFVDLAEKTYDAMGQPNAYKFWNPGQFFASIIDHLNKSNDYTIIDLKGAS